MYFAYRPILLNHSLPFYFFILIFNFVQDGVPVSKVPAFFHVDATWLSDGGEVVGNQELHPAVLPVAWVLCLRERYKARLNLFLRFFPHVSSHKVLVGENVQVAKKVVEERYLYNVTQPIIRNGWLVVES